MYEAEFQPEAWVNDYAITVDAEGPKTWDATQFVEEMRIENPRWFLDTLLRGCDYDDILRTDPNAPEWVQEWQGPFETYLREVDSQDPENREEES